MSILDVKDRIPTNVLDNKAVRYGVYDESGNLLRYEYMKREDEPIEEGTPVNKALFENIEKKSIGYNVLDNSEISVDYQKLGYDTKTSTEIIQSGSVVYMKSCKLKNGNIFTAFNYSGGKFEIRSQDGKRIGEIGSFTTGTLTYIDLVALDNGNVFVIYKKGNTACNFMILNENGGVVKAETTYATTSTNEGQAAITKLSNGNVFIAACARNIPTGYIYNENGEGIKLDIAISDGYNFANGSISICQAKNGNVFIAWGYSARGVYSIYDENGNKIRAVTIYHSGSVHNTFLLPLNNGKLVLFSNRTSGSNYFVDIFSVSEDGATYTSKGTLNSSSTTIMQFFSGVVLPDNNFMISYYNHPNSAFAIYKENISIVRSGENYDSNGAVGRGQTLVLLDDGRVMVTYYIYDTSANFTILGEVDYFYKKNYVIDGIGKPLKGQTLKVWNKKETLPETIFNKGSTSYISSSMLNNGNILIAYSDNDNSRKGTFVILDSRGAIVKSESIFLSGYVKEIKCTTLKNGNAIIAYCDESSSSSKRGMLTMIDQNGNYIKGSNVFNTTEIFYTSCTALDNGNVLIAYSDSGNSNYGEYVIVNPQGEILSSARTFNASATIYISSTKLNNGNVLIAYTDNSNNQRGAFVILDQDGNVVKSSTIFDSGKVYFTSCTTLKNNNVLIAYQDSSNSQYGTFVILDQDGNLVKSKTVFNSERTVFVSCTTSVDGNVVITYARTANSYGAFIMLDQDGNIVKNATSFRDGVINYVSSIALNNGNVAITYCDSENNNYGKFITVNETYGMTFVKNTLNNIEIDTLLQNGFYELLYDDKFIAKEVRV